MAWLPDGGQFSKISLCVLTQLMNEADRQTDTAWQHRPRLCIASRGKNVQRKSCKFRFICGFYVSISIQNILKGNLQPKWKGASVWPKLTAVITRVIFTCPSQAGPVFRLDRGLVYFAQCSELHSMQYSLRIRIYRWPYCRHFVKTNHIHSVGDNSFNYQLYATT